MARAPEPPREVWIDERLVVRASAIEGRGLFATDHIPAGTTVIRLGGRLVSSADLEELIAEANADPATPYVDAITVFEDRHLVLPPGTKIHYGNHSCDPTMWHVGPYEIATRRALAPGEEATIDYGTSSGAAGYAMVCGCGSQLCRGAVSSDDWRLSELQHRYSGHWVPALQARIDAMKSL